MNLKKILFALIILTTMNCTHKAETSTSVKIVGEMKNVMRKGQLYGNIDLDTISDKVNLYGLGPVEYLAGEILIFNGKAYKSTVVRDSRMNVQETYDIKAPFFAYANISNWNEHILSEDFESIAELEKRIDELSRKLTRPFMFKLQGMIKHAKIHIVNLPEGSKVSSPEEAHRGLIDYHIRNEPCEIIGFFSTEHQTIFTHHDTFLHMHLITNDKTQMGHLDELSFESGKMKLYLPK